MNNALTIFAGIASSLAFTALRRSPQIFCNEHLREFVSVSLLDSALVHHSQKKGLVTFLQSALARVSARKLRAFNT
jgi:hypothetical protein